MISRTMIARFMSVRPVDRRVAATAGVRAAAVSPTGSSTVTFEVLQRRLLQALELDERLAVVQDRLQLVVLRGRQIALRLDDEVVGRHADLELALLGLELLLRQLARRLRRLHALDVALRR